MGLHIPAVGQSAVDERESAQAQPGDAAAAVMSSTEAINQRRVGGWEIARPRRQNKEIGFLDGLGSRYVLDPWSLRRADTVPVRGPHHRVPALGQALSAHLVEHQERRHEMEHDDAVEGVDDDPQVGPISSTDVFRATHATSGRSAIVGLDSSQPDRHRPQERPWPPRAAL